MDDTSADLIISQLLLLDAQDQTKDIKLFINSPGGSITAGVCFLILSLQELILEISDSAIVSENHYLKPLLDSFWFSKSS